MFRAFARASALALALAPISSPVSSIAPATLAAASTASPEPRVVLYCARGAADYPDAEITLSAQGPYALQVVYVDFHPSAGRARWTLRDCLYTAQRLDGSRPIVASLWVRGRERGSPRELILQCLTPALQRLPIAATAQPNMPPCPEPLH
jgi:hypothetical protein